MSKQNIGSYLKETREKNGKTFGQISNASGIDKGYLSKVERGERNPKPDTLLKLANAYGADYNKLMQLRGYSVNESNKKNNSPESELSPNKKRLLDLIESASPEKQKKIETIVHLVLSEADSEEG